MSKEEYDLIVKNYNDEKVLALVNNLIGFAFTSLCAADGKQTAAAVQLEDAMGILRSYRQKAYGKNNVNVI